MFRHCPNRLPTVTLDGRASASAFFGGARLALDHSIRPTRRSWRLAQDVWLMYASEINGLNRSKSKPEDLRLPF